MNKTQTLYWQSDLIFSATLDKRDYSIKTKKDEKTILLILITQD